MLSAYATEPKLGDFGEKKKLKIAKLATGVSLASFGSQLMVIGAGALVV
jgi:hypothetical protein